jgi:hypothetical protein
MSLLLDSERAGVDVDKSVRRTVVTATGRHRLGSAGAEPANDMKVFESRPDWRRFAPGVLGASSREPTATAVQPTLRPANFAGAGRAGFR